MCVFPWEGRIDFGVGEGFKFFLVVRGSAVDSKSKVNEYIFVAQGGGEKLKDIDVSS
jgi:hypothetical protein